MVDRTQAGLLRNLRQRLTAVERRLARGPLGGRSQVSGNIGFGAAAARWVRVATLDGSAALNGAGIAMSFGGGGTYSNTQWYTGRIHFVQRGDNVISCRIASDFAAPANAVTFHTLQISTYVFELWAALPGFNVPLTVWGLNFFPDRDNARCRIVMDSVQASAPAGLSAAIVPVVLANP